MDIKQTLRVTVLSPQETLFSGLALAVSSQNSQGKFDIVPKHAHFVTFIDHYPIVILKPNHQKVTFDFPLGIIYVSDDQVKIYTQPLQDLRPETPKI